MYNAPPAPKDPADYRKATDRLKEEANTGSIPWIIKLGEKLANNNNLVDQQTAYFRQKDPSLPPRMHKLYGLYKAIVHEVNNVSDNTNQRPWKHLESEGALTKKGT